jgi:ribosomal protein S18 acetylase RimI-like enzyme
VEPVIRPFRPDDLDDLYRICLLTGDAGQDATALFADPKILGEVFAAPYGVHEPSLAFVAEDESGVGGYIVGALDSRDFEGRLERYWWPALRERYPEPSDEVPEDQWTADERAAYWIHHPFGAPDEFAGPYPSHLHINLVPRMQGKGVGRRLTSTFIQALRDQGSAGVHLFVYLTNLRAAEFYRRFGFTSYSATDAHIFTMNLREDN